MSMLAMASPAAHNLFQRGYGWEETRPSDFPPTRPRSENERIALPSIRQAFPELQLKVTAPEAVANAPATTSPGLSMVGVATPEYIHSPNSNNKRRRLSIDDDVEERASRVPRLYESPVRTAPRQGGVTSPGLAPAPRSATESWGNSSRSSPYPPSGISAMRSPSHLDHVVKVDERMESRPMLPGLPMMNFEREPAQMPAPMAVSAPRVRGHSIDDFVHNSRPAMVRVAGPSPHSMEPAGPAFQQSHHPYPYHHPTRVQSLSLGAVHPFDRSPFTPSGYAAYPDYVRMGDFGGMGMHGDNKQRKRRGNLPKETTDKLRAWFHSHLNHPYPTEDEKQDLMRQTGLQMNQISNWFINARRRVLPGLQNNNRAVSDAMSSGRVTEGGRVVLPSTERSDYDDRSMKRGSPISDDGTSSSGNNLVQHHHHHHHHFDDHLEDLKHRRAGHLKRGSV